MKGQLNIRAGEATIEKIEVLKRRYGSQAQVVAVAVDRLYLEEIAMNKHMLEVPENAGRGLTSWIAVCSCGAQWRCEYGGSGLEWKPLNDKCLECPHDKRPHDKRQVTVRIHRQDTVDWLDGNTELAERYENEVARRMAADLHAEVTVEDGYLVGGGGSGVAYDSAVDDGEMQEARDSYEAICDELGNDWKWAE